MNFEDALRKAINESEDGILAISKRALVNFSDLFDFVNNNGKLSEPEMQRLYDALNEQDREKMAISQLG